MSHLGRREMIGLLGGLAAWPLPLGAQPSALPVVGVLLGGSTEADAFRVEAFRQGLKETGHVEGQNVVIEYRFAENDYARLPGLAADLVQRQVNVLAAIGNAASRAAKEATTTVPIVFEIGTDPVEFGMVGSLARPGGNLTGVTFLGGSLAPKQFEVLHETMPKAAVLAMLENPTNPNAGTVRSEVQAAANALGRKLIVVTAVAERDIEPAFARAVEQRAGALLVRSDVLFNGRPKLLVALAEQHALPAIYPLRDFATAGGLMSYGASLREALRRPASTPAASSRARSPANCRSNSRPRSGWW